MIAMSLLYQQTERLSTWFRSSVLLFEAFEVLLEPRDDRGVRERRRVAERLALGDGAQEPPHDLPGPRLRQVRGEQDVLGPGDRADLPHHVLLQVFAEILRRLHALLQC